MSSLAVGVDLGGTKILIASADRRGSIRARQLVPTEASLGPERVLQRVKDGIRQVLASRGKQATLLGIGVGVPGPMSAKTGVIYEAPNLPGWKDVPIGRLLRDAFRAPVFVDNDANAAAQAEHRWGAGRGVSDMVYITVSTGIGGGIIIGGRIHRGVAETAGEIGHMTIVYDGPRCHCGNRGCLEALASGTAIARRAVEGLRAGATSVLADRVDHLDQMTARLVAQAAREGDAYALRLMREAGEYLGAGIASLTNLLSPALVAVGGGVSQAGDLLLEPARRVARERAFARPAAALRIVPAELGQDVGVLGAIALVMAGRPRRVVRRSAAGKRGRPGPR